MNTAADNTAKAAPAPVAKAAPEPADDIPFEANEPEVTAPVTAAKPSGQRAEDILAMIRNRQK
jgi:hypothetical protein